MNKTSKLTSILLVIVLVLLLFNIDNSKIPQESDENIQISGGTIKISSLTLRQKIAQMIISFESPNTSKHMQKMGIGGFLIGAKPSKQDFSSTINGLQETSTIPLLIAADMEGCLNPFENFRQFPALNEINDETEAFNVASAEAKLMKELGFNINFAPVVDIEDKIWNCRSFSGNADEISIKAKSYVEGMQANGIMATSKHYPGRTLSALDPHGFILKTQITEQDLAPFKITQDKVAAIMISHQIVSGAANSNFKPSTVSPELIKSLRNEFTGLIIADDIQMLGLRNHYGVPDQMYIELFSAGHDIIINLNTDPKQIYNIISVIEEAVNSGFLSEERIDESVTRILEAKGLTVI